VILPLPLRTEPLMGTLVTIQIVPEGPASDAALNRAFTWFHQIETCCTRFDPGSELMRVSATVGTPITVSTMLFEAVRFALKVAEVSDGAFDPTLGHELEIRGFNREHRSGETVHTRPAPGAPPTWRDIELDEEAHTILLHQPLTLDLGAVAKGLAVDTAARELQQFRDFAIDAGGDLYLGGVNPQGAPWSVGIRHPLRDRQTIHTLRVSNKAVCTSGDYERPGHILNPKCPETLSPVASATVVADSAMLADALATAAFVLGPVAGIELLHGLEVEGLIFTTDLQRYQTRGFSHVA
jgi:thiamine biosynthesis lipoprotein